MDALQHSVVECSAPIKTVQLVHIGVQVRAETSRGSAMSSCWVMAGLQPGAVVRLAHIDGGVVHVHGNIEYRDPVVGVGAEVKQLFGRVFEPAR